jgi:hypothetical protein
MKRQIKPLTLVNASKMHTFYQGQKFVAVMKAKNRGTATRQNAKNRGKNRKNRGFVAANFLKIAALSRQNCRISRFTISHGLRFFPVPAT